MNTADPRLQQAVRSVEPPPELAARIRQRLDRPRTLWLSWFTLLPVAAALAAAALYLGSQQGYFLFTPAQRESFMAAVVQLVPDSMKPGLLDHLHCSVYGEIPSDVPPLNVAARDLPDEFRPALDTALKNLPAPFRLYSAHECTQGGNTFIHFQFKTDSRLVSVIVTRRNSDSFVRDRMLPAAGSGGLPVYATRAAWFHMAAIESGPFFAYVVSDLSRDRNLALMRAMAPSLHQHLTQIRG